MEVEELIDSLYDEIDITDMKIKDYLEEFIRKIMSVCNRIDYPKELNYLAKKYARNCHYYYKNIENNSNGNITSISDNGQSISFKTDELIKKENVDLDKIIENNKNEISLYAFAKEV